MTILSADLILLLLLLSLIFSYLIDNKYFRVIFIVSIPIFTLALPIIFGFTYAFEKLIFSQILLFIALFLFFTVVFFYCKIHKLKIFLIIPILLLFIYFSFTFFFKGGLNYWTIETVRKSQFEKDYNYEYYDYFSRHGVSHRKYPILYKYYLSGLLKKGVVHEKKLYDDFGNSYTILSDGNIVVYDSLFNSKIEKKLPDNELFDIPTEKYITIKKRNLKK
ncbi:hypothetical protein [Flavobacterium sp.]|jgi:hypothetical protein|uniref:hypothetical protein n=1 Tax=Flavobacterium sp. TaxID=239 RepID=UPI0037BEB204